MLDDVRKLQSKTTTKWEQYSEMKFPIGIEATQIFSSGKIEALSASFSWKFKEDIPNTLFKISNLNSQESLVW